MMSIDGRSSILIVDDSPGNIDLFRGILGVEYDISSASSGMEGLELATGIHPT